MTEALETAIRSALLQYARVRELEQHDGGAACKAEPVSPSEDDDSNATCAKKNKMLCVARMLVDANPRIRNRGMAGIGHFLESSQELTEDELLRVWSTLYYAAWLSDKPLVQREFFVRASRLHRRLRCPQAKHLFFCSFFRVLVAEWGKIDRHRTNKFLLFCRIFLAEWMHVMRLLEWDKEFVRPAADFLWEEVMQLSNARGVALHVVDILTDEFRALLDADEQIPASGNEATDSLRKQEKQQEERLHAFSWLFLPVLRCCCFSSDSVLVARAHERGLRQLGNQDVDLQFVAAALFALASDKRVRSENLKQLYASYEHVKEELGAAGSEENMLSEHRVGKLTSCSFAELIVRRVFSGCGCDPKKAQAPYNPLMEYPRPQKRQLPCEKNEATAEASSELSGCSATSGNICPVPCSELKRDKKRLRLSPKPRHGTELPHDKLDRANKLPQTASARRAAKDKLRKRQSVSGKKGHGASDTDGSGPGNGLLLPIVNSGTKGMSGESSGSPVATDASSDKEVREPTTESLALPGGMQLAEEVNTSFESKQSVGEPTSFLKQQHATSSTVEAQSTEHSSRRRSLRISEANSNSKRVLFNLKKNKVVAFSRHAPSLAVGPACPLSTKSSVRGAMVDALPAPSARLTDAPPRSILRAAKIPGPPTSDEVAPLPPIRKLQRPGWLGSAAAELMALLKQALVQRMRSNSGDSTVKQRKKLKHKKGVQNKAKHHPASAGVGVQD